jgi:plastocyanin
VTPGWATWGSWSPTSTPTRTPSAAAPCQATSRTCWRPGAFRADRRPCSVQGPAHGAGRERQWGQDPKTSRQDKRLKSGNTIAVDNRFFSRPNVRVKRGATLNWQFSGEELHNVTLASGPIGFGSPNLDEDRTFSQRFTRNGKYWIFCALHPVQMSERVVVKGQE